MNKYISLELAKKLAENWCELESDEYIDVLNDWSYPLYDILNDICVKYAKEFFGNEMVRALCSHCEENEFNWCSVCKDHYNSITMNIFDIIKSWKKQEAENYIFEHCLFNPKN